MHLRCNKRSTRTTTSQLIEVAFTTRELQQALSKLNARKAAGPDGIAPELLRHLSSKGSSVLSHIHDSSWLLSWCPQSWRSAYVIPFLKKGKDPAHMGRYRQIALTLTIGKVLDRLIANRLSWWLEGHSALFLAGRSTEGTLYHRPVQMAVTIRT